MKKGGRKCGIRKDPDHIFKYNNAIYIISIDIEGIDWTNIDEILMKKTTFTWNFTTVMFSWLYSEHTRTGFLQVSLLLMTERQEEIKDLIIP